MTNDEIRMTKAHRNPNDSTAGLRGPRADGTPALLGRLSGAPMCLPNFPLDTGEVGEMLVATCQRQVILLCQRPDPQIVVWNKLARLRQFRLEPTVNLCGNSFTSQQGRRGDEALDAREVPL